MQVQLTFQQKDTCLHIQRQLRYPWCPENVCVCRLRSALPQGGHHSLQADRYKRHVLQSRGISQSPEHHPGSLHRISQSGKKCLGAFSQIGFMVLEKHTGFSRNINFHESIRAQILISFLNFIKIIFAICYSTVTIKRKREQTWGKRAVDAAGLQ